jgi:hypothetical protein
MLLSYVLAPVVLLVPHPLPDDRTADFDPQLDFSQFKTFAPGQSRLRSPKPELNNGIIRKKTQDALRRELTRRGLVEEAIQGMKRQGRELVWRGIYHDDEGNASKISSNLPRNVEKYSSKNRQHRRLAALGT